MRPVSRSILLGTLVLTCQLAGSALCVAQVPPAVPESCRGNYVIGPEDVLDISVWNNTELTRVVPVRPDGKVSLPLLNDVQAAGFTPMQLRDTLTTALTVYMPRPVVSVLVREIHSIKVTVIGQVKNPGRYELKDRATMLDVLALAGGLTEFASRDRIVLLRLEQGTTRRIPFHYDKLTSSRRQSAAAQENFCVQPGDVVLVP